MRGRVRRQTGSLGLAIVAIALVAGLPASAQDQGDVDVDDNSFVPDRIEVEAGATVVWTHVGENPHTVTADDGSFDSHSTCPPNFATGCMENGDTYEQTFDEPGEVAYYCKVHGDEGGVGMAGVIVVQEAAQPAREEPAPAPDGEEGAPGPGPETRPAAQPTLPVTGAPALLGWLVPGSLLLAVAGLLRRLR